MANAAEPTMRRGPLNIGDLFLKFEIRGLLGRGGHAWVYQGYDPFLDREVAIKVIPNPAEPGRDLRQRAQLEARVLCKLENPNVVRLMDAGATNDGAVYIVMEILHGRTLRDVIHDFGQLNVVEVLSLGAKIADGVHAAHAVNVIHRDLKPENVFVLKDNGLKVLDFGIAKFFGYGAATTQKEVLHGTMMYMSPEHLQGMRVTVRSDIYALGTMLYEAFIDRNPCMLGVQDPSLNALTYAQINRMPPLLDELTPAIPRFVARAIHRMIAKEPDDRFASMAEVAEILRAQLDRFIKEAPGAPGPRQLWLAQQASPASSVMRLGNATTEIHELSPPTAPPVTLPTPNGMDTSPVSRPPFSEPAGSVRPGSSVQVTEQIRIIPTGGPTPPLFAVGPSTPQSAAPMTPSTEVPVLLSRASSRPAPSAPEAAPAPHSERSAPTDPSEPQYQADSYPPRVDQPPPSVAKAKPARKARARAIGTPSLVFTGVALGVAVGLIVGVARYWTAPAPATSSDERIVVVSTQPPAPVAEPPVPPPAMAPIPSAETAIAVSAAPPTPVAEPTPPLAHTEISTPKPALPAPTAHAAAKPASKAAAAMPASGLWDMSDLDAPARPKSGTSATPKPAPTAATKPRPSPIYGADELTR